MDVAVINIPNAIIKTQTNNEKYMTIININGVFVYMLLDITSYINGPYVTTDSKEINQLIT